MFEKYLVEFVGTMLFMYVFFATQSPLAIGATLAFILLLSGGHINPVVTISMASYGKIPTTDVLPYCISQALGGLVALEIFKRYKF